REPTAQVPEVICARSCSITCSINPARRAVRIGAGISVKDVDIGSSYQSQNNVYRCRMAADTTLMPPPRDRGTGAASSQVQNTAIHPDQRPTSSQEIGTPAGFGHGRRLTWTILVAFGGIVLL